MNKMIGSLSVLFILLFTGCTEDKKSTSIKEEVKETKSYTLTMATTWYRLIKKEDSR